MFFKILKLKNPAILHFQIYIVLICKTADEWFRKNISMSSVFKHGRKGYVRNLCEPFPNIEL